jgi:drug/metabolite transporter (DMT)-like permease
VAPTTTPAAGLRAPLAQVVAGLAVVYVVWGSTYLGIRIVVAEVPPLLAMGLRFLLSGALLALIIAARLGPSALRVTRPQLRSLAILGLLFIVCGNGGVAVGEQTVTSGLAALLVAAMPLWVVLMRRFLGHEQPRWLTWLGVLVGLSGIAVLARPGSVEGVQFWGVLVILGGSVCWATGVFLSGGRLVLPRNPFVSTVYEMLTGGVVMTVAGTALGGWSDFSVADLAPDTWWAFFYLVTIGSIAGYGAFVWLLAHAPVSLVTTYAFVNPVVAVFLGWLILSEPVTGVVVAGGALAVVGVALVVQGERPRPATPTAT